MLRYSMILFKLMVLFAYVSYRLFKHVLKSKFFTSCERFLWLSEQIFKLHELENFDLTRRIRIKHQLSCLEFDNYQSAIEYIEEVSRELQMPSEYNQVACDVRFKMYNERLEEIRRKAVILLASVRSSVRNDN